MKNYTEREIEIALKEQHRNTRHDAIDVLYDIWGEWENKGYDLPDDMLSDINRKIMNLRQRKP